MRVLLTGAAGFIGSHLCDRLLAWRCLSSALQMTTCLLFALLLTPNRVESQTVIEPSFLQTGQLPNASDAVAPVKVVRALRVATPISVDGRLDDEAWTRIRPVDGFRQRDPDEGDSASERTEVRVAYTERVLFVAVRMFDRSPSEIVKRIARRDTANDADSVAVYLDPRHDHLTGFRFGVSAAGVQEDAIIYQDDRIENNWDAVWTSAVTVDDKGWTAEFGIPFSQIRVPHSDDRVWGINVSRYIHRRNETAWLELVPKAERGLASRMAPLDGIDIDQHSSIELTPFSVLRHELTTVKPGNPLNDGSRTFSNFGVDMRWGSARNTILTATVNPDFGQVEVNPSVVNLTTFETFFPEKRPFFLEGSEIFDRFGAAASPFYSRRIGSSPHGAAGGDFVNRPAVTTILAAAKLVGRTASGWNFGALAAATDREVAHIADGNQRSTAQVEPLTGYSVGRVRWDGSHGGIGGIATAVRRDLETEGLTDVLAKQAYAGGTDAHVYFDDARNWELGGNVTGSWLQGSRAAITRQQQSSRHYYQRPDAVHLHLDPSATTMAGWSSSARLFGNGGFWTTEASASATSPGYEINDLGFQPRADEMKADGKLLFQKLTPDRLSRYRWISVSKSNSWNYAHQKQQDSWWFGGGLTFSNYWFTSGNVSIQASTLDDRETRGGPLTLSPFRRMLSMDLGSDNRKTSSFYLYASRGNDELGGWNTTVSPALTLKPSNTFNASFGPTIFVARSFMQYVGERSDAVVTPTFGTRYLFSNLAQTQLSLTTRANLSLTRNLSLEVYAEPFLSVGDYSGLKQLEVPHTLRFLQYGLDGGRIEFDDVSGAYDIQPADGGRAFSIGNPDFNVTSLVLKSVFRWEWHPGSTLFIVWTQNRFGYSNRGDFYFDRDVRALVNAPADNVFLMKFNYWIGR